jgi:hypothetical protein
VQLSEPLPLLLLFGDPVRQHHDDPHRFLQGLKQWPGWPAQARYGALKEVPRAPAHLTSPKQLRVLRHLPGNRRRKGLITHFRRERPLAATYFAIRMIEAVPAANVADASPGTPWLTQYTNWLSVRMMLGDG